MYDIVLAVQFPKSINVRKDYCLRKLTSTVVEKTKWLVNVQKVSQTFYINIFYIHNGGFKLCFNGGRPFELNTQRY